MDILWILFILFVNWFAWPLLIIGLIWFFFVARRLYREKKSLDAFKGNVAALAMTKDRLKADGIRTLGIVLFPVLLVGVSFVLMNFLGLAAAQIAAEIAFGVAAAVTALCYLWSRRLKKRYSGSYKENFVKAELAKVFDNLNYEPDRAFEPESVRELNLFTSFDRFSGNDLIRAGYKGINFAQCDVRVEERYTVTVTDNDGDTRTKERWRDVFSGRAMRFDFAEAFRGKVQVVSKDFDGAAVKRSRGEWRSVETELAEFGKYFDVYAPDPLDAMAALTPQMIEGVFYLKKALDVPTALYFTGNSMFVFLALTRDAFDVSGKHTLLEESRLLERDIALVTGFMDVMYFKRQAAGEDTGTPENERSEIDRAEIAASVADKAGPSEADKVVRRTWRGLGMAWNLLPKAIVAVYLISAMYGLINLPGEIAAGTSPDARQVPTIGFLLVSGVFICLPALRRNIIFSTICLTLYLLFMAANL